MNPLDEFLRDAFGVYPYTLPTGPKPLSRSTDPRTSHEGAYKTLGRQKRLQAEAYALVRANAGCTASELAAIAADRDPRRIGRRLVELERRGRIARGTPRKCRITGYRAGIWEAK